MKLVLYNLSEEEKEENKGKSKAASIRETSEKLKKLKEIIDEDEESNNKE